MRWTATAEIANELRTNAAVRYQKLLDATAATGPLAESSGVGGSPGTSDGEFRSELLGAGRRKRKCSGTVTTARVIDSVIKAWRQPCVSISQLDSGEKTKLAQPPTSVTAVSACRRRSR